MSNTAQTEGTSVSKRKLTEDNTIEDNDPRVDMAARDRALRDTAETTADEAELSHANRVDQVMNELSLEDEETLRSIEAMQAEDPWFSEENERAQERASLDAESSAFAPAPADAPTPAPAPADASTPLFDSTNMSAATSIDSSQDASAPVPDPAPAASESPAPSSASAHTPINREILEATLDVIRESLQADGGDVVLVNVSDDGVVTLDMVGACAGCPLSEYDMSEGIERILKEHVPGVTKVEPAMVW